MSNVILKNGIGTNVALEDGVYTIDSNSGAFIIDDIVPHIGNSISKGESIQTVFDELFNNILPAIPAISEASMIITDENGKDSEYPDVNDLREDALYIRILFLSSDTPMYISCWILQSKIEDLYSKYENTKLDSNKLQELSELINQKASLTQLLAIQTQINLKADIKTVNSLQSNLDKKANVSDLNTIKNQLSSKASKIEFDELNDLVQESRDTLESLSEMIISNENIKNIDIIIDDLNTQINNKLDKNKYNELKLSIDNKVEKQEFNSLKDRVDDINNLDIDSITDKLNSINKDVENLINNIREIDSKIIKKSDISYVDSIYDELVKNVSKIDSVLENKVNKSEIISKVNYSDIEPITTSIVNINQIISELNNKIEDKIDSDEVDKKINGVEHLVENLNRTHTNDIKLLNSSINKLNKKSNEFNTDIKELQKITQNPKSWITVLSPEDYKRIPNASIKQDQLYMCVKYGKPYALYIGKILIAERNTIKGSGFAYNFPLTF